MTKDEIKAYAQEMIDLAAAGNCEREISRAERVVLVQQAMAICGMPFDGPKDRAAALNAGAGPGPVRFIPGSGSYN